MFYVLGVTFLGVEFDIDLLCLGIPDFLFTVKMAQLPLAFISLPLLVFGFPPAWIYCVSASKSINLYLQHQLFLG